MITKNIDLRDKYFSNEIYLIGDLVEDIKSGESVKILDRGSNYITVATSTGIVKKWLNEVVEITPVVLDKEKIIIDNEFELLENNQIKIFGYETRNFDKNTSIFIKEQFLEFDDIYSKHQIIKCLDMALTESDTSVVYSLLEKIEKFYSTQNVQVPLIVEVLKNETERTRIAEILASVAGIKPSPNNNQTVTDSIKAFKVKYKTRQQWEVLLPFLQFARSSGLSSATQNLPYGSAIPHNEAMDDVILATLEENIDLLVADINDSDITDTFTPEEFSTELMSETTKDNNSSLKMKHYALNPYQSTAVLMQRARRLAEIMVKNRLFAKPGHEISKEETDRFNAGNYQRRTLIAKLSQNLIEKVRMMQSNKLNKKHLPDYLSDSKAGAS